MEFKVDERDIRFCLFEERDLSALLSYDRYKDQDQDLYGMVLSEAIKFATGTLAPMNQSADEKGCGFDNGKVTMPPGFKEAYKQYCEAGWNTVSIHAEVGGQGLPGVVAAASSESLVASNCAFVFTPGLTAAGIRVLDKYGADELKELYLDKMVSGQWSGTMCLTEPNVGTALADIRTTAKKNDDGSYSLTGTKMFITSGEQDLTENIVHMVLARVEGMGKGIKALGLFLVPKYRANADGSLGEFNDINCTKIEEKMGIHGSPTCMMNYGDNGACQGWIIGDEGDGIQMMFNMMNEARIGVGMQGVALTGAVYQYALQYAKERVQGSSVLSYKDPNAPRVTIIEHPDVKRMLAEMKAYSEGTRSLLYYLAECLDKAENDPDEAVRAQCSNMVELLTPIAKAYPTDRAFECASTAIQIMGGVGYCKEYPVEQYCRDAKISAIYEGTNGVQALDLVGRKMSQGGGALFMTYMQSLGEYIDAGSDHEEVVDLLKDLTKGRDKITEIAMVFMNSAKDNPIYPVLSATPFLEAFGHVIVAQRLIVQASIAVGKLKALAADKGESNYAKLAADNDDAKFYYNKLLTARFFCKNILPAVDAVATRIGNSDESVLQMAL